MNATDLTDSSTFALNASADDLAKINAEIDAAEADDRAGNGGERLNEKGGEQPAAEVKKVEKSPSDRTDKTAPKNSGTPDAKAAEAKADAKTDTKTEPPKPDAKPGDKAQSDFRKAQQRKDDSWKALNAEKDSFKAEREAFAKERADWARQKQAEETAKPQHKPEDYDRAAAAFEEKGQFDLAELARAEAQRIRANPPAASNHLDVAQKQSWEVVKQQYPALMTKGSPENKLALELLEKHPALFDRQPNAPEALALLVRERMEASAELTMLKTSRVPELEGEVKRLQSRIQELEEATSPNPGGGSTTLNAKSFEEMNMAEQEAELRAMVTTR